MQKLIDLFKLLFDLLIAAAPAIFLILSVVYKSWLLYGLGIVFTIHFAYNTLKIEKISKIADIDWAYIKKYWAVYSSPVMFFCFLYFDIVETFKAS